MPWKDETLRRQKDVNYYYTHQEAKIAAAAKWNRDHPERFHASSKRWRDKNKADIHRRNQEYIPNARARNAHFRIKAMEYLGNKCVRCGYDDVRALQFNHKNGDGYKERSGGKNHTAMLIQVINGNRPDIELLCANCNIIHARENGFYNKRKK